MRYKIIAPIQGDLFTQEDNLFAEHNGYLFQLMRDPSGKITHIAINMKVPEELKHKLKSTVEPGKGIAKLAINIGGDEELNNLLISQLRNVETELAFSTRGAFWMVGWNNVAFEFLPETSEDNELITISGFSLSKRYPPMPTDVTLRGFNALIELVDEKSYLLIPKGFWQQGMNFFRTYNYIQAFYSFFFILEDLIAEGKTSEKKVLKRFEESSEFHNASEDAFTKLKKNERHRKNLEKFLAEENLEFKVESLPRFIFLMRGRTHHYSGKNRKTQATPHNQKDFESISFLAMLVSTYVLGERVEREAKETGKKLIFSNFR